MSALGQVTQATFSAEVLQADVPVLVDFYADWCGPCRIPAATLSQLSDEFSGRLKVVKVNVETESQLAVQFQVDAMPTLVLFHRGAVIERTAGFAREDGLRQMLVRLTEAAPAANIAATT